jgi:hypothetical protein
MSKAGDSANKLTQREYAAIHLAVPESGTPWLDEMIRKSPRYQSQTAARGKKPSSAKETIN